MIKNFSLATLIILTALALAGCSTVGSRIRHNSNAFNALSPAQQTEVRSGAVKPGFTRAMVFLAWGKPDSEVDGAWVYLTCDPLPHGPMFIELDIPPTEEVVTFDGDTVRMVEHRN